MLEGVGFGYLASEALKVGSEFRRVELADLIIVETRLIIGRSQPNLY